MERARETLGKDKGPQAVIHADLDFEATGRRDLNRRPPEPHCG